MTDSPCPSFARLRAEGPTAFRRELIDRTSRIEAVCPGDQASPQFLLNVLFFAGNEVTATTKLPCFDANERFRMVGNDKSGWHELLQWPETVGPKAAEVPRRYGAPPRTDH